MLDSLDVSFLNEVFEPVTDRSATGIVLLFELDNEIADEEITCDLSGDLATRNWEGQDFLQLCEARGRLRS